MMFCSFTVVHSFLHFFTGENMFQIINDLFLAGSETTSVTLEWAMLYMTEFPEIQKKCQDEIERVCC